MLKQPLRLLAQNNVSALDYARAVAALQALARDQEYWLIPMRFKYMKRAGAAVKLTANDLEFACCEYRKYLKIQGGGTHKRFHATP